VLLLSCCFYSITANSTEKETTQESCMGDIPVYPGSTEEPQMRTELEELVRSMEFMSHTSGGEIGVCITNHKIGEVVQFYQNHPPQGGWKRTLNLTSPEKGGIIVWEKGDYSAQVLIAEKEQKTVILLGCAPKFDSQASSAFPSFTKDDGLAGNCVIDIAVSTSGIVWLATGSGLSRFDGMTWTTYTKKDGLPRNCITAVVLDKNDLPWIGTDFLGCSHFDGDSWTSYDQVKKVSSIDIDSNGDIWVGSCDTSHGGVYYFDGEEWTRYNKKNGLGDNCVQKVSVGPDGIIWAATKKGVARFNGSTWTNYTEEDGLVNNRVNDVAVDQDGRAWLATKNGISCFDGETWKTFSIDDGLVASNVKVVTIAPDGSLWFGTTGGVSHLAEDSWQSYTKREGLPGNNVSSIFASLDGKIWLGIFFKGVVVLSP
jgi:sugar lactone lactonase YvrE